MTTSLNDEEKLKGLVKAAIIEVLEERGDLAREAFEGARGGEQSDLAFLSGQSLAEAYGPDEPEYSLDLIKESNPEYERR